MTSRYPDLEVDEDSLLSDVGDQIPTSQSTQGRTIKSSDIKGSLGGGGRYAQSNARPDGSAQAAYEHNLKQELANVRKVNEAIEGVLANLNKARSNMKSVNQSVNAASSLLNIWTRILSQTEHNQRLILDPSWQGASRDIQNMEDEAIAKQQAAERREAEDQERREAAARKAEEDEKRRAEVVAKPRAIAGRTRGGLGRSGSTRVVPSAQTSTSTNVSTSSTARTTGSTRRGSSIGRGTRGARGRGL